MRDGFRCILTGVFDYTSTRQNPELDQLRRSINARAATVQACHILNESTMQDVDPTGTSEESTVSNKVCAATVSRVLHCPDRPHLPLRQSMLSQLCPFSNTSDLEVMQKNSLK